MKNVEGRAAKAVERFMGGYNCSQAVLCAFSDLYGIDEVPAFKLAEGFGLGMSGYKDECGAVTGMFMVLGLDNSVGDLEKGASKLDTYDKIRTAGKAFENEMGSIMCRELLRQEKELRAQASEEELAAAAVNNKSLICIKCVDRAARYLEEYLGNK